MRGAQAGLVMVAAAWAIASTPGCGASPGRQGEGFDAGGGSSGSGGGGSSGSSGSGSSGGIGTFGDGGGGDGGVIAPGCSAAAEFVYVIDVNGTMYQFNPPTLAFTMVGQVTCASSQFFSMAVDRNAVAWVLVQDGSIVRYDINAKTCTPTTYAKNQHNFQTFGMGFSTDAAGSSNETLFVSDSELFTPTMGGLARIDTSALTLTPVAQYDQGFNGRRAEMTGTGDGRLFAAFEGTPYVVAEIDKTSAHIKSQAPQTPINYPPDSSNFAFAFWGGDFWLFVGPGGTTDVFQYQPSNGMTTKRETEPFEIVGAGVSTCAPTTPPQ
ncbi:MAG TPA: hypothetical protein VF765_28740 [Polyangiaceae bacterium]